MCDRSQIRNKYSDDEVMDLFCTKDFNGIMRRWVNARIIFFKKAFVNGDMKHSK